MILFSEFPQSYQSTDVPHQPALPAYKASRWEAKKVMLHWLHQHEDSKDSMQMVQIKWWNSEGLWAFPIDILGASCSKLSIRITTPFWSDSISFYCTYQQLPSGGSVLCTVSVSIFLLCHVSLLFCFVCTGGEPAIAITNCVTKVWYSHYLLCFACVFHMLDSYSLLSQVSVKWTWPTMGDLQCAIIIVHPTTVVKVTMFHDI